MGPWPRLAGLTATRDQAVGGGCWTSRKLPPISLIFLAARVMKLLRPEWLEQPTMPRSAYNLALLASGPLAIGHFPRQTEKRLVLRTMAFC
jgi:hypothetical protein